MPSTEQSTAQFVIPAGGGATFSAANNIATITFNAAHGLTMVPSANVLPNYYISFGGSTSGLSGTGILVGNIFRILTIPSTTAITIYTTITAATVTSLTGIPVFFPSFAVGSANIQGQPTQTISTVVTPEPFPVLAAVQAYFKLGANCNLYIVNDTTNYPQGPLDQNTGNTPATAQTTNKRTVIAASGQGFAMGAYPWMYLAADGTTATSYLSVIR